MTNVRSLPAKGRTIVRLALIVLLVVVGVALWLWLYYRSPAHIFKWAAKGNVKAVERILNRYPDAVGWHDEEGQTPLHRAAMSRLGPGTVRLLISRGADVNAGAVGGDTPLHCSWVGPVPRNAELLLVAGADVNRMNHAFMTPLHTSFTSGHVRQMELLLAWGADPNLQSVDGLTALSWLVGIDAAGIAPLLRYGARVDIRNNIGHTAYDYAADYPDAALPPVVRHPVFQSICDGKSEETIGMLRADPALLNVRYLGWMPVHEAALAGDVETVASCLELGSRVDLRASDDSTAVHWAAVSGNATLVRMLIDRRASVNAADERGWTPLHRAALDENAHTVELLLGEGADANAIDEHGWTPLHVAAWLGQVQAAEQLLDAGADPNAADQNGWTPLFWAVSNGDQRKLLFDLLIQAGAEIDRRDVWGWTLLDLAENTWKPSEDVTARLRALGAPSSPELKDPMR